MVQTVPVVEQDLPPGLTSARYPLIVVPPLEGERLHETMIEASPGIANVRDGALGDGPGARLESAREHAASPVAALRTMSSTMDTDRWRRIERADLMRFIRPSVPFRRCENPP